MNCGKCNGEAVFVNQGQAIGQYWYCRNCKLEEKEWETRPQGKPVNHNRAIASVASCKHDFGLHYDKCIYCSLTYTDYFKESCKRAADKVNQAQAVVGAANKQMLCHHDWHAVNTSGPFICNHCGKVWSDS